jgi:predicted nucleotidyltransferase
MSLDAVVRLLEQAGITYALIGATALAARGVSRSTMDVDLMTADHRVLSESFWAASGLEVDVRKGEWDDPLGGVVRVRGGEPVDVVVAKYRWQKELIDRAARIELTNLTLPVPGSADLILLKLFAGGYRDLLDIRSLLDVGPREALIDEVTAKLPELPRDMTVRWGELVANP